MGNSRNSLFSIFVNGKWVGVLAWALGITVAWLFIWLFPWQERLQSAVWLRLGIALTIFLTPGLTLYGLLANQEPQASNYIAFGFVISHFLVAVMGIMGRLLHFSFDLLMNIVMGLGVILLLLYLLPKIVQGFSFRFDRTATHLFLPAFFLFLIFVLVSLIVIRRDISDDDLTYLAYLTTSQYSTHLSFNDILFGLDQLTSPRFWLMSAPLGQAFLAELGNIPGVSILAGYYQPFLVAIAMMSWYGLARTLHLSRKAASASVVLQILFLLLLSEYIHPGAPFFGQLDADKATASFIFAPVFIHSEILLLRIPTKRNFILCLLAGLSLTFMHPIALAYSVFIGGMLVVLTMDRTNLRASLVPLIVILIILSPQVILRFLGAQVEKNVPYSLDVILKQNGIENMITIWRGTQFYGFTPHILEMAFPYGSRFPFLDPLLKWGWLVVPVGALIFAVRKLKQSDMARYIFSAFVLCALAGIPFTGWILGYFLSAWALERAVWLFPFGLSAVFLLSAMREETTFGQRIDTWAKVLETKINIPNLSLIFITVITSIVLLMFMREQGLPDLQGFKTRANRYADIAKAGQYLDHHIQHQAFVMGSDALNDLIPGVSSKAKLITFRTGDFSNMSLFPVTEIEQRISDRQMIFSETATAEAKLDLLRKYDIRFIVLTGADRPLFADLLATYPSLTTMEKVNRFFVIEIKGE
jgi:hypothetical protein